MQKYKTPESYRRNIGEKNLGNFGFGYDLLDIMHNS
jgi:hypothetical protein